MKTLLVVLSLAIGPVAALAQPMASDPRATTPDKQAVSKSCSDQANTKGLHGKARKQFRSECKRAGRKPS